MHLDCLDMENRRLGRLLPDHFYLTLVWVVLDYSPKTDNDPTDMVADKDSDSQSKDASPTFVC